MNQDLLLFEGKLKYETEKAVLFQFSFQDNRDGTECWIPFSQVSLLHINKNGGKDKIKIPKWLAKSNKLLDEEET